jgi:hypothetical protein
MRKVRVYGWAPAKGTSKLVIPFEVEFYVHELMSVEETFGALYPYAEFGHIVSEE